MNTNKEYTLAVVGKETYPISIEGPQNKITFLNRTMTATEFKETFFNKQNLLCIAKTCKTMFEGQPDFDTCPQYTPSDDVGGTGGTFNLYDCLIDCATSDLNNATITPVSKIEVKKDVTGIEYLSDLRIVSGLRWADISDLITPGIAFHVIAVFTNPNFNVKNVTLDFKYEIIEDT